MPFAHPRFPLASSLASGILAAPTTTLPDATLGRRTHARPPPNPSGC